MVLCEFIFVCRVVLKLDCLKVTLNPIICFPHYVEMVPMAQEVEQVIY